jgi:hypothetical protein
MGTRRDDGRRLSIGRSIMQSAHPLKLPIDPVEDASN